MQMIQIKLCMDIAACLNLGRDNQCPLEIDENLNVGCFLKTIVLNFFKLCVIITSHEHYKCASL